MELPRARLMIGIVVLLMLSFAGASCVFDRSSSSTVDPTPIPVTGTSLPVETSNEPCPVAAEVCELAVAFLPIVSARDGQLLAAQVRPQSLICPSPSSTEDVLQNQLAAACDGLPPGTAVDLYEFHNGKAPFYFADVKEYAEQLEQVVSSRPGFSILAVGCGLANGSNQPDCSRSALVLYSSNLDPELPVAVIFTRFDSRWRVEKIWTPFPGVAAQVRAADSVRVGIYSLSEIATFEVHRYRGP